MASRIVRVEDYDEDQAVFVDDDDQVVFVNDEDEDVFIDDDEDLGGDAEFGEEEEDIDRESMWIIEESINTTPEDPDITTTEFQEPHVNIHFKKS